MDGLPEALLFFLEKDVEEKEVEEASKRNSSFSKNKKVTGCDERNTHLCHKLTGRSSLTGSLKLDTLSARAQSTA